MSSSSTFRKLGQSELLPRYIFAESLYARRRVLEIGAVASTLGQSARFLATRGARIVVAADADLSAVQDAQSRLAGPNLRFRAPVFDDLEAGSFDLVIVADLAPYVQAPELLKDLVRLVAKNGYLMGGLRNPAGLALANVMDPEGSDATPTYGQLLDALSAHFRSIEVATQSPVLGYQLAFEKGEGLQVDGSLAGSAEAAYYVVLAGHEPVRFFDPTWVQLPPEPLAFTGGKLEDASTRARNWQERSDRLKEALTKSKDDVSRREIELKEIRAQLEGSKEVVARLTAQIESVTARPQESRQADELTQKVRRLEAELVVAKERALDSEGRVQSMREEVLLQQREQKNATVETLAAQENARLERSRREQLATELEDARTRLTRAYEDLRTHQDEAAAQRVEAERARLAADRVGDALAQKNRELESARERELRLADARSETLLAIEALQGDLKRAKAAVDSAEESARAREAEKLAAIRSLDLETQKHLSVDRELQNATARVAALTAELSEREAVLSAAETEVQASKAAATRLQRDIETLSNSERTWREMAQSYEQRLNDTLANVDSLSEQVARLDAEKEQEVARFNRLEKDLTTAVGAERSAREQAQAFLADKEAKVRELEEDREKLLERRDELEGALADLHRAREADGKSLEAAESFKGAQQGRIDALLAERDALESRADQQRAATAELERNKLELESTVADLQRLRDELSEKLNVHQTQVVETRRELDSAQNYRGALDARLAQLEGEVHQLTDRLADRSAEADRLAEELASALDRVERTEGDISERLKAAEERQRELGRERDQARQENARLSGQLDQGRARVAELAQRSARLENEAQSHKARIGELEAQSKDRQERLQETQVKFTHAAKAAATLERELKDQLEALTQSLKDERAVGDELKQSLDAQRRELSQSAEASKAKAVAAQRELETVRDSLAATEAGRSRLEALLEADRKEAAAARSELESSLLQAREQIQRMESRQEVLANESRVLQHELEAQLKRYQELEAQGRSQATAAEVERLTAQERAQRELVEAKEAAEHALQAAQGAAEQRLSVLQQEIEHFKADRVELESRLTAAQQHSEHMDAELAEAAEVRAQEAQLREAAESARDALQAELERARAAAATANEWVVGGKSENERLAGEVKSATADLQRVREELAAASKAAQQAATDLSERGKELEAIKAQLEAKELERVSFSDQLTHEKAEGAIARQQAETARAEVVRAAEEGARLRAQADELQRQLDAQAQAQRDEALARNTAQNQEVAALKEQLESVKKEVELAVTNAERAHSESRGHQAGKHQLQKEIDALRGEITQTKAALAAAGGEAQAIADAKAAAVAELSALQSRAQQAEERAERLQSNADAIKVELEQTREQKVGMEAELAAARGAAHGSAGEIEAALTARRQAEEMLIKMRARYGELELQLQTDVPQLREQVNELLTDNQMLDAERERLAAQIERLEATRTQGADAEKELKNRVEMLQRRVNAQDAELNALRRRAGILPGGTASSAAPTAAPAPAPPAPTSTAIGRVALKPRPTPVVRGKPLGEAPDLPTEPGAPAGKSRPGVKQPPRIHTAVTPVMTPVVKDPTAPPKAPVPTPPGKADDVELEVFELELEENGDDEPLLLLDDEASDPGPGSGGGKKS